MFYSLMVTNLVQLVRVELGPLITYILLYPYSILFAILFQSNFFDEYRIEGKDETNNIYLELAPDNLTRAMKSAGSAQAVKIKLTKKHTPCLTFEITLVR